MRISDWSSDVCSSDLSFAYDKSVERKGRDVEKAKALLKAAGYDRVKAEISFGNNTIMQQVFELIQAMGSEAGFDITFRPMEFADLQSTMARGDFELAQAGWSGQIGRTPWRERVVK